MTVYITNHIKITRMIERHAETSKTRLDSPGAHHHVMIRGIERKNTVDDKYDRANMVSRLPVLTEDTKPSI